MANPENMRPVPQEKSENNPQSFMESLERRQDDGFNICFGLDPDLKRYEKYYALPNMDVDDPNGELSEFLYQRSMEHIEATADYAAVYKPNAAFFEQYGNAGTSAFRRIGREFNRDGNHSEKLIVADVKRGDIGNTQKGYASAIFEDSGFDAATVNPYMSDDAVMPFADYGERGTYVIVRTSNESASKTQDILMQDGRPYWQHMADMAAGDWNVKGNIGIVIGATNRDELLQAREIIGPDMQMLAPGIGAQGGSLEDVLATGSNRFVVNVSRSHLYPDLQPGEGHMDAVKRVSEELQNQLTSLR